jgi:hypothetical protein
LTDLVNRSRFPGAARLAFLQHFTARVTGTSYAGFGRVRAMSRPPRFPLRLPVQYRERCAAFWRRGVTVSISASGAVIEGDPPDASSALIVAIDLPGGGGCLIGRARIMGDRSTAQADPAHFVVAVGRFRLAHRR